MDRFERGGWVGGGILSKRNGIDGGCGPCAMTMTKGCCVEWSPIRHTDEPVALRLREEIPAPGSRKGGEGCVVAKMQEWGEER